MGVGVAVGVFVGDGVLVGVSVGVGEGVEVGVLVDVGVFVGVCVAVGASAVCVANIAAAAWVAVASNSACDGPQAYKIKTIADPPNMNKTVFFQFIDPPPKPIYGMKENISLFCSLT
jgi:hypothetical protein